MAMPRSRRRRIAEETRLASCASGGGGFVEHHQPRCAVDQRAGNLHQLALGRLRSRTSRSGSIASCQFCWKNCAVAAFIRRRSSAPAGAILTAQKHRFRDGKVRDQVQRWITRMPAASMAAGLPRAAGDRRGGAAAVGLIDTGEDLDQRRFTGAVLANQAMNLPGLRRRVTALSAVTLAKRLPICSMTRPAAGRSPPGC